MTGRFIAVVGPSGVGKDSVMQGVGAARPQILLARRTITRPPDAGGEVFDTLDPQAFRAKEAAGDFVLSWSAHGLHYGISMSAADAVAEGRDVMANLSRSVLGQAARRFAQITVIALTADRAVLAQRLAGRGRESPAQIERRLARSAHQIPDAPYVHHIDNSGPLDRTVRTVLDALYPATG